MDDAPEYFGRLPGQVQGRARLPLRIRSAASVCCIRTTSGSLSAPVHDEDRTSMSTLLHSPALRTLKTSKSGRIGSSTRPPSRRCCSISACSISAGNVRQVRYLRLARRQQLVGEFAFQVKAERRRSPCHRPQAGRNGSSSPCGSRPRVAESPYNHSARTARGGLPMRW